MLTTQKQKLISLNLAALLILLLALPVGAAEPAQTGSEGLREALLAQQMERIAPAGEEEQAELSAQEPYRLQVGTTVFKSDQDRSGTGWAYTAANHRLTLNGYQGGGIAASGDLVIYTYGENQVTGKNGTRYGEDGIVVDGALEINVKRNSTLQVSGGSGREGAGQGVSVPRGYLTCWITGGFYAQGGELTLAADAGGHGLYAGGVSLYGIGDQGIAIAQGGQSRKGIGGSGIFSLSVYVDVNCMVVGAEGLLGGDGIFFGNSCNIGIIEGYFAGGAASSASIYNGVPIYNSDGVSWYYNEHTTLTEVGRELVVTVNEYTLRLNGNGGRYNGQTYVSDTQKYPSYYWLSDYIFQRDKYAQVGWKESNGDFVALNDFYNPEADTTLSAEWIMVDPGDIVINSLSGTLNDGSHYRSQRTALTLPMRLQGYNDTSVLGWSSAVDPRIDFDTYAVEGAWYEGGDVILPDKDRVQLLYGHAAGGNYARYHPNGGTIQDGGTILVQYTTPTGGDLEVYALDDSAMTAPQGCVFRGWSRAADVDTIRYKAGEVISHTPTQTSEVIDLYAVWEQVEFVETLEPGVQVRSNTETGEVSVELTQEWCQDKGAQTVIAAGYSGAGGARMLDAAVASCGTGDVRLTVAGSPKTPNQVKLFVLDNDLAPTCACLETVVFSTQDQN